MRKRLTYLALTVGTFGLSVLAYAQSTGVGVLKLPQEIEFKGPLTGHRKPLCCMATRQSPESSSRALSFRPAGKTHRIGILMRYVLLWYYRGRSTSGAVT